MKLKVYLAAATLLVSLGAFAGDTPDKKKMDMDPAMMEAMMKAGMPGDAHKSLSAMAGTWDTKMKFWMMPGAEPMSGTGKSENKMVMGGRYLEQRFQGSYAGMPFEGLGHTGYDNVKKQYWGTWLDSMSTCLVTATGKIDGKTMTFNGTTTDPMSGKDTPFEERITILDADHHNFEMWGPGPDGTMFKMMEIAYSRKK